MTLQDNTIVYNEIGLQSVHLSTIANNNFQDNSRYSLENIHIVDFDASNNWWGTTDTHLISSMIFDKEDESVRGQVYFLPILTEPNPNAPAIPAESVTTPTPTPTTQPEPFPTTLVFVASTGIALGVVGLLVYLKKRWKNKSP